MKDGSEPAVCSAHALSLVPLFSVQSVLSKVRMVAGLSHLGLVLPRKVDLGLCISGQKQSCSLQVGRAETVLLTETFPQPGGKQISNLPVNMENASLAYGASSSPSTGGSQEDPPPIPGCSRNCVPEVSCWSPSLALLCPVHRSSYPFSRILSSLPAQNANPSLGMAGPETMFREGQGQPVQRGCS